MEKDMDLWAQFSWQMNFRERLLPSGNEWTGNEISVYTAHTYTHIHSIDDSKGDCQKMKVHFVHSKLANLPSTDGHW